MHQVNLKYPIGNFQKPACITHEILDTWISEIETFPKSLKELVASLTEEQLNTTYRQNGWTIRQIVHHCADSHANSFIRFKLALTEDKPTIKPYHENRWAEMEDSKDLPIEASLKIIEGIHERWTVLLKHLSDEQLARTFIHPEHGKAFRIDENIGIYAWHCKHHLAHIQIALQADKN
ncbi:MAG: putative metal-dependent hydrolase [Chitinophagales bacterium]|nr:putative metal-dependent hydrolase [Chitinophagales bacterium]